jgi:hypothetical protein
MITIASHVNEGSLTGELFDEKDQILDIYGCEYACVEFVARPYDYDDVCLDDGPTPGTRQMETRDARGDSGLWGLLGLTGLLGLPGLRRCPEYGRTYTTPSERSRI